MLMLLLSCKPGPTVLMMVCGDLFTEWYRYSFHHCIGKDDSDLAPTIRTRKQDNGPRALRTLPNAYDIVSGKVNRDDSERNGAVD